MSHIHVDTVEDTAYKRVSAALPENFPITLKDIAKAAGMWPIEAEAILVFMELSDKARQGPPGKYKKAKACLK